MTNKYKSKKFNITNKKIIISETDDGVKEYICPYCNFTISTRLSDGYVWCQRCQLELPIKDTRKKSRLQTPTRNTETLVSTTPLPGYGDIAIKKPPNYKGAFKSLSEKGIKIKDYTVTDGRGKPIREED